MSLLFTATASLRQVPLERDDNIADSVQSSGAEERITMKILLFNELFEMSFTK